MQQRDFAHVHAAHCESGVMASLSHHHGLPLTEGMNNRGARNPHNGRSFIRRRRAAGIRSGLPS